MKRMVFLVNHNQRKKNTIIKRIWQWDFFSVYSCSTSFMHRVISLWIDIFYALVFTRAFMHQFTLLNMTMNLRTDETDKYISRVIDGTKLNHILKVMRFRWLKIDIQYWTQHISLANVYRNNIEISIPKQRRFVFHSILRCTRKRTSVYLISV